MSITLEDVETAIKVLTLFLKKQREAEMVLRRFQAYERRAISRGFSMEDMFNMAFETIKTRRAKEQEEIEPEKEVELTDEDIAKMKEIAKKLEQKK
jgi:hypothetical protein